MSETPLNSETCRKPYTTPRLEKLGPVSDFLLVSNTMGPDACHGACACDTGQAM